MSRKAKAAKTEEQTLFETKEYSHFYVPELVLKFLFDLTKPTKTEKVLCVGFHEAVLKSSFVGMNYHSVPVASAVSHLPEEVEKELFDVILCAPSFGKIISETNETNEEVWLRWSIEHLTRNGRLAIAVPIGLLSNYSQESIRGYLIEKSGLQAVIELPSGWAQGTAIQAGLLYITANTETGRSIKMLHFATSENVPWQTLADVINEGSTTLPSNSNIKLFSIPISNLKSSRLDTKFYDPAFSIELPKEGFLAVSLGELVEIRSGDRFGSESLQPGGIPFIQVRNITLDGELDIDGVKTVNPDLAQNSRSFGHEGDILISTAGTVGKVALIPKGMSLCIDTSLRKLRVIDKNRIIPEYLTVYLRSEVAQRQIERFISGSVIKVLSTPNLAQLIIHLPSLEKQHELVKFFRSLIQKRERQLLAAFPDVKRMQESTEPVPTVTVKLEQANIDIVSKQSTLINLVRTEFPYPISRAFTLYETSRSESYLNRHRLLIVASEMTVYYLYSVLAADQLHRLKLSDAELNSLLRESIVDYSMDKRIKFVFRLINLVKNDPSIPLFTPELIDVQFAICSEIHNKLRNISSHTDVTDAWCKKAVTEYEPKLKKLFESLQPIRSYRLTQVTNVVVRNGRPQHDVVNMMGDNSIFTPQTEDLDTLLPADTGHIILLDQDYNVLDLHPFLLIHAWESTGMHNHLCFLKQIVGQPPKKKMRIQSTQGASDTDIDMDLDLDRLLSLS